MSATILPVMPAPVASPAPPITGEVVHAFRPTIFGREHRYVLADDVLVKRVGAAERRIPLADIVGVRIYATPSNMGPALRRTVLRARSGGKVFLQSNSFARFGVIDDRGESYRRIVEALLQRLQAIDPALPLVVGPSLGLWLFWVSVLALGALVLVAASLVAMTGELPLKAVPYLALVSAFMPLGWRVYKAGRAHRADFAQLPPDLFSAE